MAKRIFCCFILSVLLFLGKTGAQIITTVAGNGTYGFSGNGGPATSARLGWNMGVVVDKAGNLYICDHDNNVIRKVDANGTITNFAGTGSIAYTGDGGPAVNAQLYHPSWITIDNNDNIYFIDQNANVVRKIDPSGIITSIVNDGFATAYSGDGGPVTAAEFGSISGLCVDNNGNLYISDYTFGVVRKVDPSGIVTTVAGTGIKGSSGDGGPANSAQLSCPYAVVFDSQGNMYIPDACNNQIRKINTSGVITTIAGTGKQGYSGDGGPAIAATFYFPWNIAIDANDNLYVADVLNHAIRKITPDGTITNFAGNGTYGYSGDGGAATDGQLGEPTGLAVDAAGNVFISDRNYFFVVRKVTNCLTARITKHPGAVALCNTGNASFLMNATGATGYQWQVNEGNGWKNVTDNNLYSGGATNELKLTAAGTTMNNFEYRCLAQNSCGNIATIKALLTVSMPANPEIIITSSGNNICSGTSIVFSADAKNAGTTPLYQWKLNGNDVGTNSSLFTSNTIQDGDNITCVLTSNNTCLSGSGIVTSNVVQMKVSSLKTPAITITPSTNTICEGTLVTFTTTVSNEGSAPEYQWFKNNIAITTSNTYTDNKLKDGDIINCMLTSNQSCLTKPGVLSQPVMMFVKPLITPFVTISTNANSFCEGKSVSFTASSVNGGTTPSYQWMKNNQLVSNATNTYSDRTLKSGDQISCILSSNASCLATPQATSNTISMKINPNPVVSLGADNTLCNKGSRLLDAGNFSAYLWNDGSTKKNILVTQLGSYSVVVTDNNGCVGTGSIEIARLLPEPKDFLFSDTAVCSYGSINLIASKAFSTYLWNNGGMSSSITITNPGLYWLKVTDKNNCEGIDSVLVSQKECIKGFYIPSAFTPNNDGKNDVFKPLLFGDVESYEFKIYNKWGQVVFVSSDMKTGWNGKVKGADVGTDVFIWTCKYQFRNTPIKLEKGTVTLIH
jgi:gliding motility-associated-like protein